MLNNSAYEYGSASKLIHWLMAALIIGLIVVGLYMETIPEEDPARRVVYGYHKAAGALAMLLFFVRIAWLRVSPGPELPTAFNDKERLLVGGIKKALYLMLLLVPLSGYVMSSAGGYPISFFGLFDVPLLIEKNKAIGGFAHDLHGPLAFTLLALVVLHIAGAIKHRLADKGGDKDILKRML